MPATKPNHRPTDYGVAHLPGSIFDGAPIISVYTRAQALSDGVLVDVTKTAREAGFRCPVAVTAAVWAMIENIPAGRRKVETVAGRLWDVIWMARMAARLNPNRDVVNYRLELPRIEQRLTPRGERGTLVKSLTLKLHAGPGDNGELVITIMQVAED